jgi:hypothetical protein
VGHAVGILKPFQRFLTGALETVETVPRGYLARHTWLKPGVNENAVSISEGTLSGKMPTI